MITALFIFNCLLLLLLITLSAFFSSSETVLLALSPVQVQRIRERNRKAGTRLEKLLADPATMLSTVLIGNTFVNVAIASLGYAIIHTVFPAYSGIITIPTITVVLLIFGEVAPKRFAISNAEQLAPAVSLILIFWIKSLRPFSVILQIITHKFRRVLRPERKSLNDEELMTLVEVGAEQGLIDAEERSMVDGILRLSELNASDVMTPRVDMIGIDLQLPPEQHLSIARQMNLKILPVFNRTPDAIEGFLNVVNYLIDPTHNLRKAMTPAFFIPENVTLDDLLITFQRSGRHIACVLDEYGGTAGIITKGDILELVIGSVEPRGTTVPPPDIQPIGEHAWIVNGSTSLDELNHTLDLELEADDADRISGWVTFHAGHIPKAGEIVEAQNCRVHVHRLRAHRIDQILLERLPDKIESQDDDAGWHENEEDA